LGVSGLSLAVRSGGQLGEVAVDGRTGDAELGGDLGDGVEPRVSLSSRVGARSAGRLSVPGVNGRL